MAELGLTSYRFSIAWGRVLPHGTGRESTPPGLAFYDKLVDTLLAKNIAPMVTLYHWDLPAALDERDGWLSRDVADWFAEYAYRMFNALDDRVTKWVTLNEPWVVMHDGYVNGIHAPGHRNLREAPLVTHNLLRAHGKAVQAYRAVGKHEIGLVVNLEPKYAASDFRGRRGRDSPRRRVHEPPVSRSRLPRPLPRRAARRSTATRGPPFRVRLAAHPDSPSTSSASTTTRATSFAPRRARRRFTPCVFDRTISTPRWTGKSSPPRSRDALLWVKERYGDIPLYVTENGAAFYDPPHATNGMVDDPLRVWYLREHLRAAHDAIAHGVDLRGYYAWSLLDNFEWSHGYSKRFGIVHVDFDTLARTPKSSARVYAKVIRSHGAVLADT